MQKRLNSILRDKNVSARAKGLFMYCFDDHDSYQFKIDEVRKNFKEGRDAILNAVDELEENGYIRKEQRRDGNLFGHNVIMRLR